MSHSPNQITTGIRSVLSFPRAYNSLQSLLRRNEAIDIILNQNLEIKSNERVLDVGCGTGRYLEILPRDIHYTGVDLSSDYIGHAKEKYGDRGRFLCGDVANLPELEPPYDLVFAAGLLHHIDDSSALALFERVKILLSPNGRFVTQDPTYIDNQSPIAKWIIGKDRGQNVRTVEGYVGLAKKSFDNVEFTVTDELLRIPYNHIILKMRLR